MITRHVTLVVRPSLFGQLCDSLEMLDLVLDLVLLLEIISLFLCNWQVTYQEMDLHLVSASGKP